ncbi:MAG TPA: DUF2179 domain-containing protein [Phycisphaerae bacterium]|nr:DUF2179 domain-containing protein [Phycisphaerae bacterium]
MNAAMLGTCLLIVLARIADVSFGTIRTICVVNGRRGIAWVLAIFEILIWLAVVSKVINSLNTPAYAIAYAIGYATGNFVGITIEKYLAFGEQVVRVFTRKGAELSAQLRDAGFGVTQLVGQGRDGPVDLLFVQTLRKMAPKAAKQAHQIDPDCFIVVDDIRSTSNAYARTALQSTSWLGMLKKK